MLADDTSLSYPGHTHHGPQRNSLQPTQPRVWAAVWAAPGGWGASRLGLQPPGPPAAWASSRLGLQPPGPPAAWAAAYPSACAGRCAGPGLRHAVWVS